MPARQCVNYIKAASLLLLVVLSSGNLFAQSTLAPRIQVGINLFPAIVAADLNISSKINKNGHLSILLIYKNNHHLALQAEKLLAPTEKIRSIPIEIHLVSIDDLSEHNSRDIGGILLIEDIPIAQIDALVNLSKNKQVILFTPFPGHIENGVMSGIQVSDEVLPLVNHQALEAANIRLKAFFLRIAVKYEEE